MFDLDEIIICDMEWKLLFNIYIVAGGIPYQYKNYEMKKELLRFGKNRENLRSYVLLNSGWSTWKYCFSVLGTCAVCMVAFSFQRGSYLGKKETASKPSLPQSSVIKKRTCFPLGVKSLLWP